MNNNYKFETLSTLHVGQEQPDPATDSRAALIYSDHFLCLPQLPMRRPASLTDAGYLWPPDQSPPRMLEKAACIEGGGGSGYRFWCRRHLLYHSGAGPAGDHIVAQKTIYGGTTTRWPTPCPSSVSPLPSSTLMILQKWKNAIQDNTKAIYLETLGNPNSDIPDIDAIAAIAHRHGLPLVIDNTFGTPYLVRPIEHGADIVLHSATKFIGGHGTTLGGIIVDSGKFDWKANGKYAPIANPNPSYHGVSFVDAVGPAAFVTYIRAILSVDVGAAHPFHRFPSPTGPVPSSGSTQSNTKKVVLNHPKVEHVNHPSLPEHPDHALYEKYFANGGGSIFTFEIKGGQRKPTSLSTVWKSFPCWQTWPT